MTHKPWQLLRDTDHEVFLLIEQELRRQSEGLEMIASENFASQAIVSGTGNPLTNKYAEGRPGKDIMAVAVKLIKWSSSLLTGCANFSEQTSQTFNRIREPRPTPLSIWLYLSQEIKC